MAPLRLYNDGEMRKAAGGLAWLWLQSARKRGGVS